MNKNRFKLFFVTEGVNEEGETYESTVSDGTLDRVLFAKLVRSLAEEFIASALRGEESRLMLSNRDEEGWT